MKKWSFPLIILSIILLGSMQSVGQQKPNFVLIVADDLGYGDLGFTGSTEIKTPHLDLLAESGVVCTNGYVSSAVCSPSRAGLITGINQVEFGHDNNIGGNQPGFDPEYLGLPLDQKTIADHLKPLGYVSGLIGKWHLGTQAHFHPLQRGFDEFWGYTGGGHDYFKSEADGRGYLCPLECSYKEPQRITYLTDDKGDECVDFIKRHKDHPFFLFASFNAPHAPMQARDEDLEKYSFIGDPKRRSYAAMVDRLDYNIGRIIDALKQNNLYDNTIVLFISDNGGPCSNNASINAPYRGQKGILLEGGIHVPFVVSWPKQIKAGSVYEEAVTALDFVPTLLAQAGGDLSKVDFTGVNLLPYFQGKNPEAPHDNLLWRFTISASIREGAWKLIRLPDRLPMLYNLAVDPAEQNNLAMEYPEVTAHLLKRLGNWDVRLPHPVFLEGAEWRKRQLALYDQEYQLKQPETKN